MTVKQIITAHPKCWKRFQDGDSFMTTNDSPLFKALYEHWLAQGEMPIGIAKARTGDPDQWISQRLENYLND